MAAGMARALARARGEEPEADSLEGSEAEEIQVPPSADEVKAAQHTIARWGRRKLSRKKLAERVGTLDASVGTRAAALQVSQGISRATVQPLVVVPNVLPAAVAEAALTVLRAVPEETWQVATASTDIGEHAEGSGTAAHRFAGCARDDAAALEPIFAALEGLIAQPVVLQCGRYERGDFIEPHDDMAFVQSNGVEHSRDIAIVLHLTPDWCLDDGGTFVDHAGKVARSPVFNSLVAFRVPRLHEVAPVIGRAARFSIYGWFLAPGKLYQLSCVDGRKQKGKRKRTA